MMIVLDRGRRAAIAAVLLSVLAPARLAAQERAQDPSPPLTLAEVADRVVAVHPSLAVARSAEDHAASGLQEAEASRLPRLTAELSASRFQEPMVVAPLHGFDPGRPPVFDRSLVQGGVALSYTLFDGGARGARIGRAEALTDAAASGVEAARASLLSETARAYLRVRSARAVQEAHERRVEAVSRERERSVRLHEQGRAPRVAVLRADAALSAARADGVAAAAERAVAERELARMMAVDPAEVAGRSLAPVHWTGANVLPDRTALLDRAGAENAELAGLKSRIEAAERAGAEARASWLPTVQLGARYTTYGASGYDSSGEWQGGIQLTYPIFTGGSRAAASERVAAEVTKARSELAVAELRIADGLDRAVAAVETARARTAALEAAVAQSEEVARIEKLALDNGAGVQTDYLAAEAELFRVRAALAEALHAEIGARVELARLMGDLSARWLADNLESGR